MSHRAEIYVNYSALQLSLIRAGEFQASEALVDWAEEWLDFDAAELEEAMRDGTEPGPGR